jgi:3-oxoacyl-[acyl-carrier protein] reductase
LRQTEKTAIITGSGRGIGRETAILLAKSGVNVVICSKTNSEINSVKEEIEKVNSESRVVGVNCDVSLSYQVNSLIQLTIEKFGNVDILPSMIAKRSGVIINVNSGAGMVGFSNLSAYCASKFGLRGLAESVSLEVDRYNIRLMTIFLGQVATRMWEEFDYGYYEKNRGKMLNAQDVGKKIVEMIFDTKKYKNGESIEMYNTLKTLD